MVGKSRGTSRLLCISCVLNTLVPYVIQHRPRQAAGAAGFRQVSLLECRELYDTRAQQHATNFALRSHQTVPGV